MGESRKNNVERELELRTPDAYVNRKLSPWLILVSALIRCIGGPYSGLTLTTKDNLT